MPETESQKQRRIIRTERNHPDPVLPPPPTVAALAALATDPIEAPFKTELAFHTKWFAPRPSMPPKLVVIHCTAATNPARSTADFFASPSDSGSTQAVADDIEGFTMVPDDAVCAGAPPANQTGLHIEQPGLVTWSRATWLSHDQQLRRVAYWVASKCKLYRIPVKLLAVADLPANVDDARGITYHDAISKKYHQSTHDDPGPNFPWNVFMTYVETYVSGGDMAFTQDEEDYLRGMMRFNNSAGPPPAAASAKVKEGYDEAKAKWNAALDAAHTHSLAGFPTGTGPRQKP